MWLGPAPKAPYATNRCGNQQWRNIFDYSGGKFSDWGMHQLDTAQWGNDTEQTGPVEVEGKGEFPQEGIFNTATQFRCEYKYANGVAMTVADNPHSCHLHRAKGQPRRRVGLLVSAAAAIKPAPAGGRPGWRAPRG